MKSVRIILMVLIPIAIVFGALKASEKLALMRADVATLPPDDKYPLVEVLQAEPIRHQLSVRAHGTVVPRLESDMVGEVSGRVIWVSPNLVRGGFFDEGESLLRLDPRDYELALARAKLEAAQAERRLAEEQAEAEVARDEWERLGQGAASDLTLRVPQLNEARIALEAAKAQIERSQRDLERTHMRAPFSGRVREKFVDVGQFVERNMKVAQLYAVDYVEVRVPLPDRDVAYLDLPLSYRGEEAPPAKDKVVVHANFGGKEHRWDGRIVRTEGELDPTTRMLMVVVQVENPYGRGEETDRPPLMLGMFVSVELEGKVFDDVTILPREVLRGSETLWIAGEMDQLEFRLVDVLKANETEVIVSGGLNPGDRIICSSLEVPVAGMRLEVDQGGSAMASGGTQASLNR